MLLQGDRRKDRGDRKIRKKM